MLLTADRCNGGIVVSIVAFQAIDPRSILGHRILAIKDISYKTSQTTELESIFKNVSF